MQTIHRILSVGFAIVPMIFAGTLGRVSFIVEVDQALDDVDLQRTNVRGERIVPETAGGRLGTWLGAVEVLLPASRRATSTSPIRPIPR